MIRREQIPPPEYAGHGDTCGCGCQLTNRQWLAEAESDNALRTVDFDGGAYRTETEER